MSTYSTTLRIELIGAGEQDGTWGDTTNSNLGDLIEAAITNVVDINFVDAQYTLTAFNGLPDEARNAVLNLVGTNTTAQNLIAPSVEKTYIIKNDTGAAVTIKTSGGTGVAVANGTTQIVWCDGTDFYSAATPLGQTTGTGSLVYSVSPTLTGVPLAPTANAGTSTTQIATTAFVQNIANTLGTMSTQNASSVTITGGSITGITDLAVADGGTGASTLAANNVLLGNGTSALQTVAPSTSGNVLTSNGTTWGSSALSSLSAFDKSLSTNGYQKLPGGLIMQWGQTNVPTDGTASVTWPITFPTACLQAVCCQGYDFNVTSDAGAGIYSLTTSGATLRNGSTATGALRWFAFGY
jgi:hypothetical protein